MNKAIIMMAIAISAFSCKKSKTINNDPIDNVPVSITINMALPSYSHLQNVGTHVFEAGGVKGVVIVHHTDDNFYAFDRCCSYQPKNACSRIEVDSSVLIFRCGETKPSGFEKCCDSKFLMDGEVFNGPATFGLKQYQVIRSGNLINIKN
jgi:hypothetical protein